MNLNEVILKGLKRGVDKHGDFAKDMLHVKPEYLLTISVADELCATGFDGIPPLDFSIKLEESTNRIVGHLWMSGVGFKRYFKERAPWLGRNGKVDIMLKQLLHDDYRIIEIKNFDPELAEVKKELKRFKDFLEINKGSHKLLSCHLAFPTRFNKATWITQLAACIESDQIKISHDYNFEKTFFDADDGMTDYYCNAISVLYKK